MLNANKVKYEGTKKFPSAPPMEPGTYPARLIQVVGLGLLPQPAFQGEEKSPAQHIRFTYQIDDEFMPEYDEETETYLEDSEDETKPRWVSEEMPFFNLESDRAKSTARYDAIDPSHEHDGDWSKLIGAPVSVTITATPGKGKHEGKIFNNVSQTGPMSPKAVKKMSEMINPEKSLAFSSDSDDLDKWKSLPQYVRDKMESALDFEGTVLHKALQASNESSGKKEEKETSEGGRPW